MQEQETNFFYLQNKGDEAEMNRFVLAIISNLSINIQNIYLRIEDPDYPFAMGVVLPNIKVETADKNWNRVSKALDPQIIFKTILIKNFSIFLERNY